MTRTELDACLVRIAAGDADALSRLYSEYYQPVFLLAASLTGCASLAEDVAQEVFLAVRACAARYRPGSNGRAWLFGVTRNVSLHLLRKTHWDTTAEGEPAELAAPIELEAGCMGDMVVSEALTVLSASEYPVVVLHVFAGMRLTEIAQSLRIPYGTVLWRYSEGRKKLKRFYEHLDDMERRDAHVG